MERKDVLIGGAAAAAAIALVSTSCRKQPVRTPEVVAVSAGKLPLEPSDPVWEDAPEHLAKLVPQSPAQRHCPAASLCSRSASLPLRHPRPLPLSPRHQPHRGDQQQDQGHQTDGLRLPR